MSAAKHERYEAILAEICVKGQSSLRDLAEKTGVSEATVRRDLNALVEQGDVEFRCGIARLVRPSEVSFRAKEMRNIEGKRAIGRLAADLVKDDDEVFLGSGTTVFQMARYVNRKRGLYVIANSTRLAAELTSPALTVILVGGHHRPDRYEIVGSFALAMLRELRGFRAFIGTDGLGMELGPMSVDVEAANLYALAIENARETIVLADYEKFGRPSLNKIVGFDAIDRIVTDRRPTDEWTEFLQGKEIEVICPTDDTDTEI